jgi:ribonucleoside-diphosphate reductase beta chain
MVWDEHERAHWVISEADSSISIDVEQWKSGKISDPEKAFIKMVLRLFTQSDTNVCDSYVTKLLPIFKNADARVMLLSFAARETTHMFGYKKLNDTLGYDSDEFLSEFLEYAEMKEKHDFMMEEVDLSSPTSIAFYLAKQILMEGVNLFGSFAMLLSFSQEGKLPGMVAINQWSIADESYHVEGLTELFNLYINEHPEVITNPFKKSIYEAARKVVQLEDDFIDLCYSVGHTDVVDKQAIKDYIRYVCDYRMQQLGLKAQFGVKQNPIEWIDAITGNTLSNFFEATSAQYSKANLTGEWVY